MRGARWSHDEKAELRRLRIQGMPCPRIVEELNKRFNCGRTIHTVTGMLTAMGLTEKRVPSHIQRDQTLAERYAEREQLRKCSHTLDNRLTGTPPIERSALYATKHPERQHTTTRREPFRPLPKRAPQANAE